jgi:hypothetical protein
MSYEAHIAEAERLEAEARTHREAAEVAQQRGPNYQCDTAPESEQLTIGGERVGERGTRVCDDVSLADRRRHEKEAQELREAADQHRGIARSMLDVERKACAGFAVEQMTDTPLGRGRRAARVEPIDGGVRVIIPAGPGVAAGPGTAVESVRREMDCHRARAALYAPGEYMGHDPALSPSTRLSVAASSAGIAFTIVGEDPVAVEMARTRAASLASEGP